VVVEGLAVEAGAFEYRLHRGVLVALLADHGEHRGEDLLALDVQEPGGGAVTRPNLPCSVWGTASPAKKTLRVSITRNT